MGDFAIMRYVVAVCEVLEPDDAAAAVWWTRRMIREEGTPAFLVTVLRMVCFTLESRLAGSDLSRLVAPDAYVEVADDAPVPRLMASAILLDLTRGQGQEHPPPPSASSLN